MDHLVWHAFAYVEPRNSPHSCGFNILVAKLHPPAVDTTTREAKAPTTHRLWPPILLGTHAGPTTVGLGP